MILQCTECRTRYLVPDTAIGAEGRTVRCANCKHSWFQQGLVLDLVARAEASSQTARSAPVASPVGIPIATPTHTPTHTAAATAADTPITTPRDAAAIAPAVEPRDYDAFAHEPPFRPRRNPARRWTIMAFAAGLAMLVGVGAILYSDAPGIATQLGFPMAAAETPLRIVNNPPDHRELATGSDLFAVSGKIVNPTDLRQNVPEIRAELRDGQGRIVYNWVIRPEASVLPPRGSIDFNSAKLDVPVSAETLVLSFSGAAVR